MDLPIEMKEARALLEQAERATDPEMKERALREALDILDSYEEDHPDTKSAERTVLINLRRSHTRRLLDQLLTIRNVEFGTWVKYVILLMLRLKSDVESVLQERPELRKKYDEFKSIWRNELLEVVKRLPAGRP